MTSIGQENLEMVMIDFFGALRRGKFDDAAALLDPDVTWQGLRDDWVCHGREQVIETFRWGLDKRRDVDALEFTRASDQVVLGVRGPSISEVDREPLEGQIFNGYRERRLALIAGRQLKSQCATEDEQLLASGYRDR